MTANVQFKLNAVNLVGSNRLLTMPAIKVPAIKVPVIKAPAGVSACARALELDPRLCTGGRVAVSLRLSLALSALF